MKIERLSNPAPGSNIIMPKWDITAFTKEEAVCANIAHAILSITFRNKEGYTLLNRIKFTPEDTSRYLNMFFANMVERPVNDRQCQHEAAYKVQIAPKTEEEKQCAYLLIELLASAFNAHVPVFIEANELRRYDYTRSTKHPETENREKPG